MARHETQLPQATPGRNQTQRVRSRNRMVILTAAQDVLTRNPGASMDEIAVAANMVRRTVHGHFPTRQDLIGSVVEVGSQELIAHVGDIDVRAADAALEVAGLVLRTWGTVKRFGPIIEVARRGAPEALSRAMEPFHVKVADLIGHGQAQGVFESSVDAGVLAHLLHSCALTFLVVQERGTWVGDESEVAYSHLLTLGVPSAMAHVAVSRASLLQ